MHSRLLALARELFHEHGPNLTLRQFAKACGVSISTVLNHVGSWLEFKKRFGCPPIVAPRGRPMPDYTPAKLIRKLQDLARTHGPGITLAEFQKRTRISTNVVYSRFDSWPDFRTRAGLLPHNRAGVRIKNEALLADLVRIVLDTKKTVTRRRYRLLGRASLRTLLERFDTWHAVEEAWIAYMERLIKQMPDRQQRLAYVTRLSETLRRPTNFQEDN
jgi:AcrR family transcriptional regulator